jgi:hypothetical protein
MAVTSEAIIGRRTTLFIGACMGGQVARAQRELESLALNGRRTGHALCDEQINPNRKRPPV